MSTGHYVVDTHDEDADLDRLHASLGHYARYLWDVQKQRIAASNRFEAMVRDGVVDADADHPLRGTVLLYEQIEKSIEKVLVAEVKAHPLADWIIEQRGIGLPGFARLLGVTGNIDRFPTVSKLWKYLGLHVVDGHAPRREQGVPWTHTDCTFAHLLTCTPDCTTNHHPHCVPNGIGTAYAPQGRVVCHQIGEAIVKVGTGGPYRRAYDERKRYSLTQRERSGPSMCPAGQTHKTKRGKIIPCVKADADGNETSAHVHNMAMRYAVKELIKALWITWHTRRGQAAADTHVFTAAPETVTREVALV